MLIVNKSTPISQVRQLIYNQVLHTSYDSPYNRLKAKIFNKLFQWTKKVGDPLIQQEIAGFTLWIPFSHQLPFILKTYPHYSSNLARIAKYVQQKYKDLTFIDIGANIGDSIALLRKEAVFPILCIEGDEQFFAILKKNVSLFTDVEIIQAYVGDATCSLKGINKKNGGTGHIVEDRSQDSAISVQQLTDILINKSLFLKSKMIKIDTDGFDCKIIRGATDFLRQAKSVIFFEYDPFFLTQQGDDGLSIFKILIELGYKNLLVYDNIGDLMLSTEVDNLNLLQELHLYFSGRKSYRYCDLCVFHAEDQDLFTTARSQEIQFFEQLRGRN